MRRSLAAAMVLLCCGGPGIAVETPPGAPEYPDDLRASIESAWTGRPSGYKPRTRHLRDSGAPRYTNRLFLEASPYLLQHAHNPVDWRPWGDEAFEEARRLGRPVLLSVGYATCHWCHVMEEESFEDPEIAEFLNRHYIAIKVDREERPDVDSVYMTAVAALTGGGGWPMTVWLTPDREPFYGATYLPPRDGDRGARFGFLTLLGKMAQVYRDNPETAANNAAALAGHVRRLASVARSGDLPSEEALARLASWARERFDAENGGLAGAPKFPSGLPVRLLLREAWRTGDGSWTRMAETTLDAMARGGLRDQLGGGFHRYTVDAQWRTPHFEQMLYDNALLARSYLEAYQATGREDFAAVARGVLDFLDRELGTPDGGFYSALDADSADANTGERAEGLYFTWTPPEIDAALGSDAGMRFRAAFGVEGNGAVEGRHILHRPRPGAKPGDFGAERAKLLAVRERRPRPLRDEKVVTSWNGMAVSAFAFAAFVLDEPAYAERAERAAGSLLAPRGDGGRLVRWRTGERFGGAPFLDDYAFVIAGLLDLFEATAETGWLDEAVALDAELSAGYEDKESGGYYRTAAGREAPLVREKPFADESEPSGNSVQALNLLRLYALTGKDGYRVRGERTIAAFASVVEEAPEAVAQLLLALGFRLGEAKEIFVVLPDGEDAIGDPLTRTLRRTFVPHRVAVVAHASRAAQMASTLPWMEGKIPIGGRPTAYVCREGVCRLPASDPAKLAELLGPAAR